MGLWSTVTPGHGQSGGFVFLGEVCLWWGEKTCRNGDKGFFFFFLKYVATLSRSGGVEFSCDMWMVENSGQLSIIVAIQYMVHFFFLFV
jgi:hypothetical protein